MWAILSSFSFPERPSDAVFRYRSRAATMTVTTASLALPCMTPPPSPSLRKQSGRCRMRASQSRTMVSSSVTAGEQSQLKAGAVKAAE